MSRLWFRQALLPEGWADDVLVEIADGHIASVVSGVTRDGAEAHPGIAIAGMPNLHSHAFQRAMAGLAERRGPQADNFWTWREAMYRFALTMSPDDVEAVAAQLYVEMLEGGFTRVGEFHYLHHDRDGQPYAAVAEMAERIVAAAEATGIGLTLLPVFYAHRTFGGAAPTPGQRRFICDPDLFGRLVEESGRFVARLAGGRLGIAPHSLRAVTPEELRAVVALAAAAPIHMHIAEQVKEVEDCVGWRGKRPVEWLLEHFNVDARWCLIHATHMSEEETRGLAASGAVAGLCPVTEANLGDGIFNGPLFTASGGRYGVGTDSNIRVGAADELRQFEYAQRLQHRARNLMAVAGGSTGRALFEAAVQGGAQALGAGPAGLAVGASADIVTLKPDHAALMGRTGDALLDSWIFAAGSEAVDAVFVRGEQWVAGGRHRERDSIKRRFDAAMKRLAA